MFNLLQRTRELLRESKMGLPELARAVGPPVSYEWLQKFAGNYKSDPTVGRVQALHDFLDAEARKTRRAKGKAARN